MALDCTDWTEWIEAIDKEFGTLEDGGQWEVICNISDIPTGKQIFKNETAEAVLRKRKVD